jgi:hypothetical protein
VLRPNALAHGKVKLLEHRVAALEELLRTKQEQLGRVAALKELL